MKTLLINNVKVEIDNNLNVKIYTKDPFQAELIYKHLRKEGWLDKKIDEREDKVYV